MAAKLPNATSPLHHDPTKFIVELDVFHQLHCLNALRKLVYPEVFKVNLTADSMEITHLEHCYDQLRQALECASDISTIYWEWSDVNKKMLGNLRTTHMCKDFGKIQNWAKQNRIQEGFSQNERVPDAPIRGEY